MKKKITYKENPWRDDPPGKMKVVKDFLPSPAQLAQAEKTTKITLAVSDASLRFFKEEAARNHVPYQVLIRRLLDAYSASVH